MTRAPRRSTLPRRPLFIGMMAMLSGAGLLASPARAAEEGAKAANPMMVPMDEIAVPIIDGAHMEGILRFTLVLRAQDSAAAARLTTSIAKLRSVAMIAGMDFARLRASPYSAVDVRSLIQSLDRALKAADPGVSQALIVRVGAAAQ
ncbi:MAG: hypothetical protein LKF30_11860 [Sphingobium sp.]|jgi:hypothetical protein|nr:hypothetical protein [Sphingobium sp.]MCI1271343.1 hypothetical protein [Sphingobium sp.]MCI1756856.1 hypothetical protein [Sphingobium sp.]MCI2053976.1 hypothetical protein [Sphingobium sp.]